VLGHLTSITGRGHSEAPALSPAGRGISRGE